MVQDLVMMLVVKGPGFFDVNGQNDAVRCDSEYVGHVSLSKSITDRACTTPMAGAVEVPENSPNSIKTVKIIDKIKGTLYLLASDFDANWSTRCKACCLE